MDKSNPTEQQNVTVSLPGDLLREVRHMAVDEGVSLSRYIALILARQVEKRKFYAAARERQLNLLHSGLALGTNGRATWTRSDLHDR